MLSLGTLLVIILFIIIISSIRQINEFERGVKFRFGRYIKVLNPGWQIILPIIERMIKVDMRVRTVDVPFQEAITKDNISTKINAVLYYKIVEAERAILTVEQFYYATSQLAQTTMRNVVGEVALDELLVQREQVSAKIRNIVDKITNDWGIKIVNVELKDIVLPEEMKRVIARQAEAERERRAIIIKAEGEVMAAENIAKAAEKISEKKGGLHLRTLQTLYDVSADPASKFIVLLPVETLKALEGFIKKNEGFIKKD